MSGLGMTLADPLIAETARVLSTTMEQSLKRFILIGDWFNVDRGLEEVNALIAPMAQFGLMSADRHHTFPRSVASPPWTVLLEHCPAAQFCEPNLTHEGKWAKGRRYFFAPVNDKSLTAGGQPTLATIINVQTFRDLAQKALGVSLIAVALATAFMGLITALVTRLSVAAPMEKFVAKMGLATAAAKDFAEPLSLYEPAEIAAGRFAVKAFLERIEAQEAEREAMYRKQVELERDAAVVQMSQNLAHDLKNPMAAFAFATRAKSWEEFKAMRDQMGRSLTTVQVILAGIGRHSGGTLIRPTNCMVDLPTVTADLSRLFSSPTFEVEYDGLDVVPAFLDAVAIERAISNLVRNAKEAGATKVVIEGGASGADLVILVKDNGPGLPDTVISKLFQRGTTYGKAGGSGIGLFNVRAIVEGHGGTTEHERHTGLTVFRITLPNVIMSQEQTVWEAPRVADARPVNVLPKSKLILVVLDDMARQATIAGLLAAKGLQVATIDNDDLDPCIVYADFGAVCDKYQPLNVRTIIDEPISTVEKATRLIIQVYDFMQRNLGD